MTTSNMVWCTDVHLDFLTPSDEAYKDWCAAIKARRPRAILLTGDIATAPTLLDWLSQLIVDLPAQLYFVLGNHDYYQGSIKSVRQSLRAFTHPDMFWLGSGAVVELSPTTSILGHSGWGDTRIGDFLSTPIRINDHQLIRELSNLDRKELQKRLLNLGTESAKILKSSLEICNSENVIIATHVPPFQSSTWNNGRFGTIEWMPDFCCGATGDLLLEHAQTRPDQHFIVYCGHTHGEGYYSPLSNLEVFTGTAEYKKPAIQGIINIQSGLVNDAGRYPRA